jgi:cellulose biosynthesis protein BcsQ
MFQLAVAVKEQDYVRRLTDYLRDSPLSADWRVTGFSSATALRQYLKGGYQVDLLAVQPELLEKGMDSLSPVPIVLLVKYRSNLTELPQVLQYQPIPQLLQELSDIYRQSGGVHYGKSAGLPEGPVIAAVYSAVGGMGKTTLALHLAQQAAINRKKVFYLNVELWNATGLFFGSDEEDALPRMLYTLQSEPEQAAEQFIKLKKHHPAVRTDYLPTAPHPDERLAMTPQELGKLLDIIVGYGEYDLIAVDLDSSMDELHLAVFERSSRIFWLTSDEPAAKRKTEIALQFGREKWGDVFRSVERKIRFVANRQTDTDMFKEAALPYVPQWPAASEPAVLLASAGYRGAVQSLMHAYIWKEERHGDGNGGTNFAAARARPDPLRS